LTLLEVGLAEGSVAIRFAESQRGAIATKRAREQFGQAPANRMDCPIESGPVDGSRWILGSGFSAVDKAIDLGESKPV
jgi:hypothetical protein